MEVKKGGDLLLRRGERRRGEERNGRGGLVPQT